MTHHNDLPEYDPNYVGKGFTNPLDEILSGTLTPDEAQRRADISAGPIRYLNRAEVTQLDTSPAESEYTIPMEARVIRVEELPDAELCWVQDENGCTHVWLDGAELPDIYAPADVEEVGDDDAA